MHNVNLVNTLIRHQNPQIRKLGYLCPVIRNNPSLDPGSFYFIFLINLIFYAI